MDGVTVMFQRISRYSRQYPKNRRSLITFSYLTNTVMGRRGPLPFLLASFLYDLLILKASRRLPTSIHHVTRC